MDGKICQNIKPSNPTRIPSSVQLNTWEGSEDQARYGFYTFLYMLIVFKKFLKKNKI